jgi:hypothetical protein
MGLPLIIRSLAQPEPLFAKSVKIAARDYSYMTAAVEGHVITAPVPPHGTLFNKARANPKTILIVH